MNQCSGDLLARFSTSSCNVYGNGILGISGGLCCEAVKVNGSRHFLACLG